MDFGYILPQVSMARVVRFVSLRNRVLNVFVSSDMDYARYATLRGTQNLVYLSLRATDTHRMTAVP